MHAFEAGEAAELERPKGIFLQLRQQAFMLSARGIRSNAAGCAIDVQGTSGHRSVRVPGYWQACRKGDRVG
jgi:hypothetical protein